MKPPPTLALKRALDELHKGGRLLLMHSRDGLTYYVVPGGKVSSATAEKIKAMANVVAGEDGLFPNCPQSWRMRTFAQSD